CVEKYWGSALMKISSKENKAKKKREEIIKKKEVKEDEEKSDVFWEENMKGCVWGDEEEVDGCFLKVC
ncbi:hypothetical protein, partial [Bacillus altitudinis]|uniref:hypothetical protein n=1 Tax=Bacillus altitudinis TaxID=293387 RepID=UPI001C9303B7